MVCLPARQQYWEYAYEDILDVIAKMPEVAALIYRCKFKDGKVNKDLSLDYTGNYCSMMGYDDKQFQDLMRLYLVIHSVRRGEVGRAHERFQSCGKFYADASTKLSILHVGVPWKFLPVHTYI